MGKTVSTDHYLPDIHDEGKIKRYGLSIFIGAAALVLLILFIWITYIGLQNQHSVERPGGAPQTSGGGPH